MKSFDTPVRAVHDPSRWIVRYADLVKTGGQVLDVACGDGRHTRYFHSRGHPVTAVDIDTRGVADLVNHPGIEVLQRDLEAGDWPFEMERFAGIVITNYLHRPHFPALPSALTPGGVLIIETFGAGNERLGRPRNPDFLLAPGELLAAFGSALQVIAYEHGIEEEPRPAVRQRLVAVRQVEPALLRASRDDRR